MKIDGISLRQLRCLRADDNHLVLVTSAATVDDVHQVLRDDVVTR